MKKRWMNMKRNRFKAYRVIDNKAGAWAYYEQVTFKDRKEFYDVQNMLLKTIGSVSNIDTVWATEEEANNRVQQLRAYYDELLGIA